MSITVGIDWAEGHHDVAVMDAEGHVVAKARIDTGTEGFTTLLRLIAENGGTTAETLSRSRPTRICSSRPWSRQVSPCTR